MSVEALEQFMDEKYDQLTADDRELFTQLDENEEAFRQIKRFRIETLEQADWAVRKIAKIEHRRAEAQALAQAEIQKIEKWLKEQEARANHERLFFETLLKEYMENKQQEEPKTKTIKLPHGKIAIRQQQPEFIRDNEILLDWLKTNRPEFIRIKEEPDWSGLKKVVQVAGEKVIDPESGEVVAGVRVEERPPKLVVEVE